MCTGMEIMALMQTGGSLAQGYGSMQTGSAQRSLAEAQAVAEADAAAADADKIRTRTRSARGAARAALAGAGVSVNSATALDIDQDIAQRGEQDALMSILGGERRGRELRTRGRLAQLEGRQGMSASVLRAGSQFGQGWANRPQQRFTGGMAEFFYGRGTSGD